LHLFESRTAGRLPSPPMSLRQDDSDDADSQLVLNAPRRRGHPLRARSGNGDAASCLFAGFAVASLNECRAVQAFESMHGTDSQRSDARFAVQSPDIELRLAELPLQITIVMKGLTSLREIGTNITPRKVGFHSKSDIPNLDRLRGPRMHRGPQRRGQSDCRTLDSVASNPCDLWEPFYLRDRKCRVMSLSAPRLQSSEFLLRVSPGNSVTIDHSRLSSAL
jgi:hypothetical protein